MRSFLYAMAFLLLGSSVACAVELTLQRISSVPAVPVGQVMKVDMAPPLGISEAAPFRARPSYEVTDTRQVGSPGSLPRSVPIPAFNPVSVSFCLSTN